MEDKLVSLEVGKFGVVLTRRLLLYMALVITAMLAIYVFVWVEEGYDHAVGKSRFSNQCLIVPINSILWSSFRKDCGLKSYMLDPKGSLLKFDQKYAGKGVSWRGWVVRVGLNEDDLMSLSYHAATVLVKMDEDDHEGVSGADLGISFSERTLREIEDVLGTLHRGDLIEFKASI